ncbi:MAG TPA: radical SAM protein [Xanthobacteraceae bacterium]|nr:radical SAM protein [Xanthobacteraceae bacterium]
MSIADTFRLCGFFARLWLKERVLPDLHVRPLVAELFLTENCNLRCVSCACWRHASEDELSTDEWKNVLCQLARLPIYKVNFTGGEPLIRSDAVELMEFARKAGIRRTHLNTNAILLTPAKLAAILAAGVRSFNISVDGPTAVHDEIRGRNGAFERTTRHLRDLLDQRDRYGLKVRLSFTLMRSNVSSLPAIAKLAQRWHVPLYLNLITDRTFLFRDPAVAEETQVGHEALASALKQVEEIARKDPRWLPRYSDLQYAARHFDDLLQCSVPCAESQLKLMIHSHGEIGGCWAHLPAFNVKELSIEQVVDSAHYRREHARLFRKDCVGCGSNYSLNLRWRARTHVEDLLWHLQLRKLEVERRIDAVQHPAF